jgi:putative oxidoreductase
MPFYQRMLASTAPRATFLIRLLVGLLFLSEGFRSSYFQQASGLDAFSKSDRLWYWPYRADWRTVPLLSVISVAIAFTKLPLPFAGNLRGLAHEARADYSMLMGATISVGRGTGNLSIDHYLTKNFADKGCERS